MAHVFADNVASHNAYKSMVDVTDPSKPVYCLRNPGSIPCSIHSYMHHVGRYVYMCTLSGPYGWFDHNDNYRLHFVNTQGYNYVDNLIAAGLISIMSPEYVKPTGEPYVDKSDRCKCCDVVLTYRMQSGIMPGHYEGIANTYGEPFMRDGRECISVTYEDGTSWFVETAGLAANVQSSSVEVCDDDRVSEFVTSGDVSAPVVEYVYVDRLVEREREPSIGYVTPDLVSKVMVMFHLRESYRDIVTQELQRWITREGGDASLDELNDALLDIENILRTRIVAQSTTIEEDIATALATTARVKRLIENLPTTPSPTSSLLERIRTLVLPGSTDQELYDKVVENQGYTAARQRLLANQVTIRTLNDRIAELETLLTGRALTQSERVTLENEKAALQSQLLAAQAERDRLRAEVVRLTGAVFSSIGSNDLSSLKSSAGTLRSTLSYYWPLASRTAPEYVALDSDVRVIQGIVDRVENGTSQAGIEEAFGTMLENSESVESIVTESSRVPEKSVVDVTWQVADVLSRWYLVDNSTWSSTQQRGVEITKKSMPGAIRFDPENNDNTNAKRMLEMFAYYRMDIEFVVSVNATAFHQGALIISWDLGSRTLHATGHSQQETLVLASMCDHRVLDVSVEKEVSMLLKYESMCDMLNTIVLSEYSPNAMSNLLYSCGRVYVIVLSELRHLNQPSASLGVMMHVRGVNPQVSVPMFPHTLPTYTFHQPGSWSHGVRQVQINSVVDLEGRDASDIVHLGSRTIVPGVGANVSDYVKRMSIANRAQWRMDADVGACIDMIPVTPLYSGDTYTDTYTCLSYCASMYTFWRGTIKIRVHLFGSKFHTGKLAFVFVPLNSSLQNYTSNPKYITAAQMCNNVTVDLKESHVIELEVPFHYYAPYAEIERFKMYDADSYNKLSIGCIYVYVVNKLQSPFPVNSHIDLFTFVGAGDDFQMKVLRQPRNTATEVIPQTLVGTVSNDSVGYLGVTDIRGDMSRFGLFEILEDWSPTPGGNVINAKPLYQTFFAVTPCLATSERYMSPLNWFSATHMYWSGSIRFTLIFELNDKVATDALAVVYVWHDPAQNMRTSHEHRNSSTFPGMLAKTVVKPYSHSSVTIEVPYVSKFSRLPVLSNGVSSFVNGHVRIESTNAVKMRVVVLAAAGPDFKLYGPTCSTLRPKDVDVPTTIGPIKPGLALGSIIPFEKTAGTPPVLINASQKTSKMGIAQAGIMCESQGLFSGFASSVSGSLASGIISDSRISDLLDSLMSIVGPIRDVVNIASDILKGLFGPALSVVFQVSEMFDSLLNKLDFVKDVAGISKSLLLSLLCVCAICLSRLASGETKTKILVVLSLIWAPHIHSVGLQALSVLEDLWKHSLSPIVEMFKSFFCKSSPESVTLRDTEVVAQAFGGLEAPLVHGIIVILGLLLGKSVSSDKSVAGLTKFVGDLGRNITGTASGSVVLSKVFEEVRQYLFRLFGQHVDSNSKEYAALVLKMGFDIQEWIDEIYHFKLLENAADLEKTVNMERVRLLHSRGVKIMKYCASVGVPPSLSFVLNNCFRMSVELRDCVHKSKGLGNYRYDPFHVSFFGLPRVGKSSLCQPLANSLMDYYGVPRDNRFYARNCSVAHWDGYKHQFCILYDDLGAVASGNSPSDITELLTVKSNVPCMLPMADLSDKGVYCTSRLIVSTTNMKLADHHTMLRSNQAFLERRNVLIEVVRKSVNGVLAEYASDFSHLDFFELDNVTGNRISGVMNYCEMSELCRVRMDAYSARQEQLRRMAEVTTDEYSGPLSPFQFGIQQSGSVYEDASPMSSVVRRCLERECYLSEGLHGEIVSDDVEVTAFVSELCDVDRVLLTDLLADRYREMCKAKDVLILWDKLPINDRMVVRSYAEAMIRDELSEEEKAFVLQSPWRIRNLVMASVTLLKSRESAREALKVACERDKGIVSKYLSGVQFGSVSSSVCKVLLGCSAAIVGIIGIYSYFKRDIKESNDVVAFDDSVFDVGRSDPFRGVSEMGFVSSNGGADARTSRADGRSGRRVTRLGPVSARTRFGSNLVNQGGDVQGYNLAVQTFADAMCTVFIPSIRRCMSAICVGGTIIAVPAHFFVSVEENTILCLNTCDEMLDGLRFSKSRVFRPNDYQDLVFYDVGNKMAPRKLLVKHFMSEAEHESYKVSPGCFISTVYREKKFSVVMKEIPELCPILLDGANSTVEYEVVDGKRHVVLSGYSYNIQTAGGSCGSMLMRYTKSSGGRIAGFHVAAKADLSCGYGEMLTREQVQEALDVFSHVTTVIDGMPLKEVVMQSLDSDGVLLKNVCGDLPIVGSLRKSCVPRGSTKTNFVRTCIHGLVREPEMEPAILSPSDPRLCGEHYSPLGSAIAKYTGSTVSFNHRDVVCVAESVLASLKMCSSDRKERGVLSVEQAINGVPGCEYYDAINMMSSPGYPYTLEKTGKGKAELFVQQGVLSDGRPRWVIKSKALDDAYQQRISEAIHGRRVPSFTQETLKDETLALAKIYDPEKRKTRVFSMLPLDFNLAVRAYFLDFAAMCMSNRIALPILVGVDARSMEWRMILDKLLEYSEYGVAGDYKRFDGLADPEIFHAITDIVNAWYDDGEENARVRHVLMNEISHRFTIALNGVFRVDIGMPSGFPLTVIYNSLLNMFYLRLTFMELSRVHAPHLSLNEYSVFVRDFVYGDDNIMSIKSEISDWFNLHTISASLKEHGIDYTDDTKGDVLKAPKLKRIMDCTLLKRGFVLCPNARHAVMSPLAKVSIEERLNWTQDGVDQDSVLDSNIRGALEEAVFHGEAYYVDLLSRINKALVSLRKSPYALSYQVQLSKWIESLCA